MFISARIFTGQFFGFKQMYARQVYCGECATAFLSAPSLRFDTAGWWQSADGACVATAVKLHAEIPNLKPLAEPEAVSDDYGDTT